MCLSDPTTAPKSTQLLQKLVFGAVDGAANKYKMCLSNLGTAPKSTPQLLQKLVFGAVDGIPPATNQYITSLTVLPQPPKAKNCFKSSFSGLWTDFQKQTIKTTLAFKSCHRPAKHTIASKARFRGCGRICHWLLVEFLNSVHSPENDLLEQLCPFRGCGGICHWLLVEFRPQPRKRAFGAILCFSGLW